MQSIYRTIFLIRLPFLIGWLLSLTGTSFAQNAARTWYKGDAHIAFKWRFGYSEFPFPENNVVAQQDALRGKFGWYDGALWSHPYKAWDGNAVHGVQLLFRGGSPYSREVMCASEMVPYEAAGKPVSFLIPFQYTIGSEEAIAFSLRVKGASEETIVCKLNPQAEQTITGGLFKVNFITLKISGSGNAKPVLNASGMMHLTVYPPLLIYGGRTEFYFSSSTRHMDVESSLLIGSLYRDMHLADPYLQLAESPLLKDTIKAAAALHAQQLREWQSSTAQRSDALLRQAKVEVFCAAPTEKRDRGERRVTAYSGNPVKDFQYGDPSPQMAGMAKSVTDALGKKFSLFRYQHHYLPWKMEDPAQLDSSQLIYLKEWLSVANTYADSVMLDLQLSPVVKLYRQYTKAGTIALPEAGIPGAEWNKITQGYLTTLRYAKRVCPRLKIIQMPYELDNMSDAEVHADAHYMFYKSLYEAVYLFNEDRSEADQLRVAGLGSNNPNSRWDFIQGFLERYSKDTTARKRLDYLTWHTYLFPGNYPSMIKGVNDSLQHLLKKYGLNPELPVIIDEMGLAEPSTIEDLSDLRGAMRKEAAMANFSAAIHHYYEQMPGNWIPISGAGWHFALLTYGKQQILSTYAKGMLLRNKLGDEKIPVKSTPVDAQGFGLHATATKTADRISVLLYAASPSIFYSQATPLSYKNIELVLKDIPPHFRNRALKVTQWFSTPEDSAMLRVLSRDEYQTLPLTRGADRYEKDFTEKEAALLNRIDTRSYQVTSGKNTLSLPVDLDAYGMLLVEIELLEK